jgi:methylated-DNA-[protein]-cysteine S-methyltransferase
LEIQTTFYKSPIGIAKITGTKNGIESISVLGEEDKSIVFSDEIPHCLQTCVTQLDEYFNGKRSGFDLLVNPQGTNFQKKVWKSLTKVSLGKTKSYLQQAKTLGDVKAIRAIATANGKNPVWIVIPCHRIIGSDGSLTGYAGGILRKKWLLDHENPVKQQSLF